MDVARDMSRAVADMSCHRLVVDLRGSNGGGIGCLRLKSLLCDDRRGVGYSLGREAIKAGRKKEQLPVFDRIPSSRWGVLPLALRFARAERSVAVFTEALGKARHHGRVALLVSEHSASAAEMVAAFASEYRLATLVGVKTPGRLVATSAFKVGCGYRVALPVAAYYTWKGRRLEGRGVLQTSKNPSELRLFGVDTTGSFNVRSQLSWTVETYRRTRKELVPPIGGRRNLLTTQTASAPTPPAVLRADPRPARGERARRSRARRPRPEAVVRS